MSSLNASLLRLKLLDALRGGDQDKVTAIIKELSATDSTTQTTEIIQLRATILHYAVQVAPLPILSYLVDNAEALGLDVNSQDVEGNTPLHLAAQASRHEVVKYLLSLANINDTVVNLHNKQPVEMCKDILIIQLMQFERAKFVESSASKLRQYFIEKDLKNLENLLVFNPRASELLDINGADPETGNTVLHEFIMKDDIEMCDWILKHGGDPFKRDRRGKLPIDLIQGKNDRLKKLLKNASREQNIMDPVISSNNPAKTGGAPTYKGYLRKWTNFASGYKLRYFVLDQFGKLSYYTNQDDTNNACRGSLNLGFATLHLDSSEKLKFEIIGKNGIRWHLKANHPIETNRWVWTLQNAITIAKDNYKREYLERQPTQGLNQESAPLRQSFEEPGEKKSRRHRYLSGLRRSKKTGSLASLASMASVDNERDNSRPPSIRGKHRDTQDSNLSQNYDTFLSPRAANSSTSAKYSEEHSTFTHSDFDNFDYDIEDLDYDSDDSALKGSNEQSGDTSVGEEVAKIRRSIDIELSSLFELFEKASKDPSSVDSEIFSVSNTTLNVVRDLFNRYNTLIQSREKSVNYKLDRQLEINKLWEKSIRQLESEIAKRDDKLSEYKGKKKQLKKFLSSGAARSGHTSPHVLPANKEVDGSETGNTNPNILITGKDGTEESVGYFNNNIGSYQNEDKILEDILRDDSDDEFFDADEFDEDEGEAHEVEGGIEEPTNRATTAPKSLSKETIVPSATTTQPKDDVSTVSGETKVSDVKNEKGLEEESKAVVLASSQEVKWKRILDEGSFLGYENPPRTRLALDEDNRPQVGLWGILKSMIGKDMTKMSLPVSFNECTSLLQRLAEDIEYSNLLDDAALTDDSTLRMVYVTAFAASEYASTINRIAKPFNPLLGETFEYCRPDKKYRLIAEQVSHHPPISACNVESPRWDYYGENAVDSKFRGRSFDFKHLGKMFCAIRPDKGVIDKNGKQVEEELYSWKKVNTSVVGIMLGNPTVDNFGKMEVTNHTTGDVAIVDLKQRGWKASSAYQLHGYVNDKDSQVHWAIAGHWNSKIFAKKVFDQNQAKGKDAFTASDTSKTFSDPHSGGKFLVWQAAPRPKIPFNLTSFAVTLNGIDDNLKEYLAPTDTRLRPDQRAMEDGKYDLASDEKFRVEQKQREARKFREKNKITYQPNWFVKSKHPITGDNYWKFKEDYWSSRKDKKIADSGDIF